MICKEVRYYVLIVAKCNIYVSIGTHVQLENKLRNEVQTLKNQWKSAGKDYKSQKVEYFIFDSELLLSYYVNPFKCRNC